MSVQTFWLERTDQVAVALRRYSHGDGGFDCAHGYHSAMTHLGLEPAAYDDRDGRETLALRPRVDHADPCWPTRCGQGCGALTYPDHSPRRTDTSELRVLRSEDTPDAATSSPTTTSGRSGRSRSTAPAAPGASWDAWWMPYSRGADGTCLVVRCPGGHDWMVDSRASNCGSPDDDIHQCWVRHGDPRECRVTVDKNGHTCSAGAGSIGTPNWHGFLRDGVLVE